MGQNQKPLSLSFLPPAHHVSPDTRKTFSPDEPSSTLSVVCFADLDHLSAAELKVLLKSNGSWASPALHLV